MITGRSHAAARTRSWRWLRGTRRNKRLPISRVTRWPDTWGARAHMPMHYYVFDPVSGCIRRVPPLPDVTAGLNEHPSWP